MTAAFKALNGRLAQAGRVRLFLDYDGTLADFAPTPEHVDPDPGVIALLTLLVTHPQFKVAIISGRRLAHIQMLVPVPGVLLAGTYGIELQTADGERLDRIEHRRIRPGLDTLRPHWEDLIAGREGFFLEDKGWALALHARFAGDGEAEKVLGAARYMAAGALALEDLRLLGGHKFLEIGPKLANKGQTVEYLLDHYPWPGALPLYIGDDDMDEEAFEVIERQGGIAVLVAREPRDTAAGCRLNSPKEARRWLETLPHQLAGERN